MAEDFGLPSSIEISEVILRGGGKAMDVTDLFFEAALYEELNNPQLHGKIMLIDMAGVLTRFGITGQEIIQFNIKKLEFDETVSFQVTEVESLNVAPNGTATYVLAIAEEIIVQNSIELVSQAYEGTITSIVESIYNDYLGRTLNFVEESSGTYRIIIPNWKPFQAINWLMKRAVNANGVPMALTNTWRNGTSILSYDTMFSRQTMEEFFINSMPDTAASVDGNAYNYRQIMQKPTQFYTKKHGNALEQIYKGTYAYTSQQIDTTRKSSSILEFTSDYSKDPRLNEFAPVSDKKIYGEKNIFNQFKTKQQTQYYQGNNFGDNFLSYNSDVNGTVPLRNNYLNILQTYQYDMTIHGRFDIEVGSIVDITFPNNRIPNEQEPETDIDNKKSGRHLVAAAAHTFRIDRYMMNIECCTDGFGEDASNVE